VRGFGGCWWGGGVVGGEGGCVVPRWGVETGAAIAIGTLVDSNLEISEGRGVWFSRVKG